MIANVTSHKLRESNPACTQACTQEIRANVLLLKAWKTLFINTQLISKMYKGIRKKGEFKGRQVSTN